MKVVFDVVGAVIEKDGRILVCQRKDDDWFGSQWEFPGGKIEKGEGRKEALIREIKEEIWVLFSERAVFIPVSPYDLNSIIKMIFNYSFVENVLFRDLF